MKKIAVFPGSFDPITIGHIDIINRSIPLFDEIIIAIGIHSQKKYLFELEDRKNWIKKIFSNDSKIKVDSYTGLTVNYCDKVSAKFILRGVRSSKDFEYEKEIAHANQSINPSIETLLVLSKPELSFVSSSIVREILNNNGNVEKFVSNKIVNDFK